jgi:ABC-type phosphonate transport system ATPase subunit
VDGVGGDGLRLDGADVGECDLAVPRRSLGEVQARGADLERVAVTHPHGDDQAGAREVGGHQRLRAACGQPAGEEDTG